MTGYKVNSPSVIFESMDNEVILINLDLGYYYCLRAIAADIWVCLTQGVPLEQLTSAIAAHVNQSINDVSTAVETFIQTLLTEKLMIPVDLVDATQTPALTLRSATTWITPALEKYVDMQHLLLLDPIHDVDEQGWPNQPMPLGEPCA